MPATSAGQRAPLLPWSSTPGTPAARTVPQKESRQTGVRPPSIVGARSGVPGAAQAASTHASYSAPRAVMRQRPQGSTSHPTLPLLGRNS